MDWNVMSKALESWSRGVGNEYMVWNTSCQYASPAFYLGGTKLSSTPHTLEEH